MTVGQVWVTLTALRRVTERIILVENFQSLQVDVVSFFLHLAQISLLGGVVTGHSILLGVAMDD